jgi:hypothetical protein
MDAIAGDTVGLWPAVLLVELADPHAVTATAKTAIVGITIGRIITSTR